MKPEVKDAAKQMLTVIAEARRSSETQDFHSMFLGAENIISYQAYLISPLMDLEQAYRRKVVEYMDTDSAAKGEAKAKASDEYKDWKKLEKAYDLGNEQIMLLKKFKDNLEMEYRNSGPVNSPSQNYIKSNVPYPENNLGESPL